jgi:hypothetical protein
MRRAIRIATVTALAAAVASGSEVNSKRQELLRSLQTGDANAAAGEIATVITKNGGQDTWGENAES